MNERNDDINQHVKAGRTRKDEARADDPAAPDRGVTPSVPTYTDEGGTSDLGVDEPVLPEADPDATAPTGMYAGETEASRAEEEAVRETLEQRFPATQGDWKTSGAMPPGKDRETP